MKFFELGLTPAQLQGNLEVASRVSSFIEPCLKTSDRQYGRPKVGTASSEEHDLEDRSDSGPNRHTILRFIS